MIRTGHAWRVASRAPVTYALRAPDADYRATDVTTDLTGSTFTARMPDGDLALSSPLRGEFNVYNVLAALAAALARRRAGGHLRGRDRERGAGSRPL